MAAERPSPVPQRILILNPDLPVFPGRAMHEYLNTIGLRRLGCQVGLVSTLHTQEQQQRLPSLADEGVELFLWRNPHLAARPHEGLGAPRPSRPAWRQRLKTALRALWDFGRVWPRPADVAFGDYVFRNIAGPLWDALSRHPWDALVVIQSRYAPWVERLPEAPLSVLVFHDVRSLMYEQKAAVAERWWQRLWYRFEARRYRRFERFYAQHYDLSITVSTVDEAYARQHFAPRHLVTVPIPIDPEYFRPLPEFPEVPGRIVFTGTMNHPPNVDAVVYFAREIFPSIREQVPQAEFWIVGRDPTPEVVRLGNIPGVVVTGYVEDIRQYMAAAQVIVVPLRYGAGMRNKILEAWGMEKCVVSTTIGAAGLHYEDGVHLLIADEREAMRAQIVRALTDARLRQRVQRAGRAIVLREHHPRVIARKYHAAMQTVYQHKRRASRPKGVVIDLHWMMPGVAGGIEHLARAFLHELMHLDRFNRYVLFGPRLAGFTFDLRYHPNFRYVPIEQSYWRKLRRLARRALYHALHLPSWRSDEVAALEMVRHLQSSISYSISGYIHPSLHPLRNIVLVPDIQHEYYPEFFPPEQLRVRRQVYREAVARAAHIGAISEFTRQSLIERYQVPPEKVTTTYLAADPIFHPRHWQQRDPAAVLRRYRLPAGEYLFFPANTWRHKNHITLLRALVRLRQKYRLRPLLVCTGAAKEAHEDLQRFIVAEGLTEQVRFLGYVPKEDLPLLYNQALMMTFPSLFEGFGMPILEAMWTGTPVIASNVTSIPEVAGEAALLVPPLDVEAWAEGIRRLATDSALRARLRALGQEQAQRFSWRRFTLQTVRIFQEVSLL